MSRKIHKTCGMIVTETTVPGVKAPIFSCQTCNRVLDEAELTPAGTNGQSLEAKGKTELINFDPAQLERLRAAFSENMEGLDVSVDTVTVPTGGGLTWEVPDVSGIINLGDLIGVIVAHNAARAYWPEAFSGGKPPSCSSSDGITGVGSPGGECSKCPFSEFGSAGGGRRGQACKQTHRLFFLRQTATGFSPMIVSVPPASIKAVSLYMTRLSMAGILYFGVITRLGLDAAKNEAGIAYSKVTLSTVATLNPNELKQLESMRAAMANVLKRHPVENIETTGSERVSAPAAGGPEPF